MGGIAKQIVKLASLPALSLCVLTLAPVTVRALQNSTTTTSAAVTAASESLPAPSAAHSSPAFAPQSIRKTRVRLFFLAAREPMAKLAPRIYEFASNCERCRLNSGAKACDLPTDPLKNTDLKMIFKYYIKEPVEAALDQQQLNISRSDWSWKPYFSRRNP